MIRVELPFHLRTLAGITGSEVSVEVEGEPTIASVLDTLEVRYPMLRGTIREYETGQRRAYLRFFACANDISFDALDSPLPPAVADGSEPLMIIGAIAGG